MINSGFSEKGLPIGNDEVNMTYLYGLSDFFSVMFENTEIVNLLLEATSESAADIYNRFLQLTSTASLTDIQTTVGSHIKLVLLKSTDAVVGGLNTFTLPSNIVSAKFIANKPLLPTSLLEDGSDYRIVQSSTGYDLVLSKSIESFQLPTRVLSDGVTKEYALWFTDVELDEQLISNYYGKLIQVTPQASTELFKNFVYGLYYMYSQGPSLSLIRKGLNLALGIPLARSDELVLDIRNYLDTDQYQVITDKHQYVIPYGIYPSVVPGQYVTTSDELAQWVEIKDWMENGSWWVNMYIPASIIPALPVGQTDRHAYVGSKVEYLMAHYLKNNTFLVNIKVSSFKNNQVFTQLADIINRVKPSYTAPIYVWSVPYLEEDLLTTDTLLQRRDINRVENLSRPIGKMVRNNLRVLNLPTYNVLGTTDFQLNGLPTNNNVPSDALTRGTPMFTRMSVPTNVANLMGGTKVSMNVGTEVVTGFINQEAQFKNSTETDSAWINTLFGRGEPTLNIKRSVMAFSRGHRPTYGIPVQNKLFSSYASTDQKVIPMYTISEAALQVKCNKFGVNIPDRNVWMFDMLGYDAGLSINSVVIDGPATGLDYHGTLVSFFSTIFSRVSSDAPRHQFIPEHDSRVWVPSYPSDVMINDKVMVVRIIDDVLGVYLITSNTALSAPAYDVVSDIDNLAITINTKINRGMGPSGSPYYLLRGRGNLNYNNVYGNTNSAAINDPINAPVVDNPYTDSVNLTPIMINRSGTVIKHLINI